MEKRPDEQEYFENLRRAWRERAERAEKEAGERRQLALDKAAAAAEHLKKKYGVRSVYLYGSLVWSRHFTERSDIDLLVEGFPAEKSYWKMLVELEAITDPVEISVVLAEDAAPSLLEKAKREGKLL